MFLILTKTSYFPAYSYICKLMPTKPKQLDF
nr:MAG TPA: hypothetical protein [Bacteriophage sp.]